MVSTAENTPQSLFPECETAWGLVQVLYDKELTGSPSRTPVSGGCCSYAAVLPDANFPDIHPEGSPGFSDPHAPHPTCPGTLAPLVTLWLAGANLLSPGACGGPWKATANATLPPTRYAQEKHWSLKSQF